MLSNPMVPIPVTARPRSSLLALCLTALFAWGCGAPACDTSDHSDGGSSSADGQVGQGQDIGVRVPGDASGACGSMNLPCCTGMLCLPGYACTANVCVAPVTDGGVTMPTNMDAGIGMFTGMDGAMGMMTMPGPPDVLDMAPVDANPSVCRAPVEGAACAMISQTATPVMEMRVASAPPPTTAGYYPAGSYHLSSATLYTGPGGASGPSGLSYAMTLQVNGVGSVDYYQVTRTQDGCPTGSFRFSGDTFSATTALSNVGWMCPTCVGCGNTLAYTGTLTELLLYFPQPDGSTLAAQFDYLQTDGGMAGCGVSAGVPCCGTVCMNGLTCTMGICASGTP